MLLHGVLFILILLGLTGCGSARAGRSGEVKREEYIGMLGAAFGYDSFISEADRFTDVSTENEYYSEIQAASEWGVIGEGGEFYPNDAASIGFALETAVRAIGIDKISASGTAINENALADFYVTNIASIDLEDPDAPLTSDTAVQVLEYARKYKDNLVLPQTVDYEFADAVKPAESGMILTPDGDAVILAYGDTTDYAVGDIIYFDETADGYARAMKVLTINENRLEVEDASVEETFQHISISGTFAGNLIRATSASDGTVVGFDEDLYDEMHQYGMSTGAGLNGGMTLLSNGVKTETDKGSDHVVFTASFAAKGGKSYNNGASVKAAANGNVKVGITNVSFHVNYKNDWGDVKEIGLGANFDTVVSAHVDGSASAAIPLGDAYFQILVFPVPVTVRVALTANLGADGNIDVSYTTENVFDAGWKKGTGLAKSFRSTPNASMEADVTLTAEASALLDLRVGILKVSESAVNAQITCGVVAVAKVDADLLGDQPDCIDVKLYVPLRWGINQQGCILTFLLGDNAKASKTVWDETNSPVSLHFHFEDGVRTAGDVCTRKDAVTEEFPLDLEEPLEYTLFEFEKLDFDFIELERNAIYLQPGESRELPILSVPDEYAIGALVYEVGDAGICTISGTTIVPGEPGSTIVRISTPDGIFTASLAVTVNDDYTIEGFEKL